MAGENLAISEMNSMMNDIKTQRNRYPTGTSGSITFSSGMIVTAGNINSMRTWIQELMNKCPAGEPALPGSASAGALIQRNMFNGMITSLNAVKNCHSNCHSNCYSNCDCYSGDGGSANNN